MPSRRASAPSWAIRLTVFAALASASPTPQTSRRLERRQAVAGVDFLPNQTLPSYALQYSPLFFLHSEEKYFPGDPLGDFLTHVYPYRNYSAIPNAPNPLNASSFANLTRQDGIYLTGQPYLSILDRPMLDWLYGAGPPDANGLAANAPALIVAVDKSGQIAPGVVDVFYMTFYPWNRGNYFYNNRFGDHLGDWENTMIRFVNGTPAYVAPEAHGAQEEIGADAYTYDTMQQRDGRPVVYIANGTHGMYPVAGEVNYTGIPSVPIYDQTDAGHLWDLTLNFRSYFYSGDAGFTPTNGTKLEDRETAWLSFEGSWGDEQYNSTVANQTCIGSECFYSSGPKGPTSKSLGRGWICAASDCTPQTTLPAVLQVSTQDGANSAGAALDPRWLSVSLAVFTVIVLHLLTG